MTIAGAFICILLVSFGYVLGRTWRPFSEDDEDE